MINSYKKKGHGYIYVSLVTLTIFSFATIRYVDDRDLLLQELTPMEPNKEFIKMI